MDKITSLQNPLIKSIVALHDKKERDKKELIILEGEKLIEGATESGIKIENIFSTTPRKGAIEVDEKVMKKISTTTTPPKILALAKKPTWQEIDFKKMKRILLLDSIQDAGNLGTIIRTAAAFEIEGIILYGNCTDPYSPKVLRSTVGTVFKMPILQINEISQFAKSHAFIATVVNSSGKIKDMPFKKPFVLMFGSEARGLSNNLLKNANCSFTLDMGKNVESLNLAMSVGICLWEIYNK
jgi:TrmH family RNA methyltransferase